MATEKITRRAALKTILASLGGLGAAAFLPSRWVKPVVESGALPAHAQTSGDPYHIEAVLNNGVITIYAYYPGTINTSGHKHLASPAKRLGIPAENKEVTVYKVEDKGNNFDGPYLPSTDNLIVPWIGYKDRTDSNGEFSVEIDPHWHNPVKWSFRGDNGSKCECEYLS